MESRQTSSEHRQRCVQIAAELEVGYNFPHERIIVVQDPAADTTPGGILIPDQAKVKPIRGTIVAFGQGIDEESGLGNMQPLDIVLYTKYNPLMIRLDDSGGEPMELLVLHPRDVYVTWARRSDEKV